MSLLSLREVTKRYRQGGAWGAHREVQAVRGVSLDLEPGRCLAVVGASGSGKSTLGRLALGLEKPDTGQVLYRGRPLHSYRGGEWREARRNLQVVFQNSQGAVNPRFTARDIIGEPLANFHGMRGDELTGRVAALLESVGLQSGDMAKRPHQFSGGELQRICLARAIAPNPEIIVLDEAVSSLDMLNQCRIVDLLLNIKESTGTAFLFISHDLRTVCRIADSLLVMDAGEPVCECADIADGNAAPDHPCLRRLAEAILPEFPQ